MIPISNLGLLATLLLPATATAQARVATLARAQETFDDVDTNKDGKLSPEEVVAKLQLSAGDVRGIDADKDGFWSKDEFLLFYRQRIVAANVKPSADLEAEATRILAARKAKATERNLQRDSDARGQPKTNLAPAALTDALDALQVKASAGQAKDTDFDRVRDLLVAEARESDRAAKGQDPAAGEKSELQQKLLQSIERLRAAAVAGTFSREEYQALRQSFVERARSAANGAAQGQAPAANPELAAIEKGLNEALDRLEQRAVAGGATREDFEKVRDQLVARARAAANGSGAPGAAEAELQGPLHRKMIQSLERIQNATLAGNFSREEFRTLREGIVQRFRNAEAVAADGQPQAGGSELQAIEQGLAEALDRLEKRAANGNPTREDFQRVREQLIARARAAANGTNAGTASEPEANALQAKLLQSIDRLEAAAQKGTFSREEYRQLRDSMIHRAREIENPGQPRTAAASAASDEAGANQALDELEKRVDGGQVAPADFRRLRELIAAKAQSSAGKTDPAAANEAAAYQKLMQALDRLEKAAQNGNVDRQEFKAFKDSFVHRARQIASDSQQSSSRQTNNSAASEQDAAGKRTGSPTATPTPVRIQPDKGAVKRADPAREAEKGKPDDAKPAPQPAPASRPKPAGSEPERPQPVPAPQQPPHRPASEPGGGKP